VFLSPDGGLSLVPFATFQRPDGHYLIEEYTFTNLAAGRDLLGFGAFLGRAAKSLILGDPDFDMSGAEHAQTLASLNLKSQPALSMRSEDMAELSFDRLPSTRKEALSIQRILGPQEAELRLDRQALEEVLLGVHGPRVLHLATHAYFLSEQDISVFANKGQDSAGKTAGPQVRIENPLLRSGLVLAGANKALGGDAGASGVVTAEKVMGIDLKGTDLVVLSACSTGTGEVRVGEGVYGLQRAFTQAGAKSLVMSMWPVPDEETNELMVTFYGNLAKGQDRAQALRQAALKAMRVAVQRRGSNNPLFWGAFVFLGDPRGSFAQVAPAPAKLARAAVPRARARR
jgi:CHAT domain-containing protein